MTLSEIKTKYPEIYRILPEVATTESMINLLDENGIFVNTNTNHKFTTATISQQINGLSTSFGLGKPFKTRKEATDAAIDKAFEMLKNKL